MGKTKLKTTALKILKNAVYLYNSQGGKAGANVTCTTCQGRGIKISLRPLGPGMMQQIQSVCTTCNGEGNYSNKTLLQIAKT